MSAYTPLGQIDTSCLMSHSLGSETASQETKNRDSHKDKNKTTSLKYLAYKILHQSKTQDKDETKTKNKRDKTLQKNVSLSQTITAIPVTSESVPILEKNVLMTGHYDKPQSDRHLFIDANGNALRCSKCKYARTRYIPEAEREQPPMWHGLCLLDRDSVLNIEGTHSRCALHPFGDDASIVMQ